MILELDEYNAQHSLSYFVIEFINSDKFDTMRSRPELIELIAELEKHIR